MSSQLDFFTTKNVCFGEAQCISCDVYRMSSGNIFSTEVTSMACRLCFTILSETLVFVIKSVGGVLFITKIISISR